MTKEVAIVIIIVGVTIIISAAVLKLLIAISRGIDNLD